MGEGGVRYAQRRYGETLPSPPQTGQVLVSIIPGDGLVQIEPVLEQRPHLIVAPAATPRHRRERSPEPWRPLPGLLARSLLSGYCFIASPADSGLVLAAIEVQLAQSPAHLCLISHLSLRWALSS